MRERKLNWLYAGGTINALSGTGAGFSGSMGCTLRSLMTQPRANEQFALCVENKDTEDLEKRKIYVVLPDEEAEKEGYLRVIDESGEDYLYPASYFVLVQLPAEAQEALRAAG
jgi:hypothetical protein